MIGVYIAFALNDCQINKLQEIRRKESISSMKEDLLKDKVELEKGLRIIDTLSYKINGVFRFINNDTSASDSLTYFVTGLQSQPTFYPTNFTFQSLVSSGDMGGINDLSFRKDLLELYNGHYTTIKELDEIGLKNFQDLIIPALIEQGGQFDARLMKTQSFAAMAGITQSLLISRKKAYRESSQLIDKILNQIEIGGI